MTVCLKKNKKPTVCFFFAEPVIVHTVMHSAMHSLYTFAQTLVAKLSAKMGAASSDVVRSFMVDGRGRAYETDVLKLTTEPVITRTQVEDRTPLRGIGVLWRAEAPRPFSLIFPQGRFGGNSPVPAVLHDDKYVIHAPAGLPLGGCVHQKLTFCSRDGEPMTYTCTHQHYSDQECKNKLLPHKFVVDAGSNTVCIVSGLGGCLYAL